MAVTDAFDNPSRFQFYKNRRVIGCAGWSQHGRDVQLQRIIAGQIEQIFAVCQNRIATQPQFLCTVAQFAVADFAWFCRPAAGQYFGNEIIPCADDGIAFGGELGMQWNHGATWRSTSRVYRCVPCRYCARGNTAVQGEIEPAAFWADYQGVPAARAPMVRSNSSTNRGHQRQIQRQRAEDHHGRLPAARADTPGEKQARHHPPGHGMFRNQSPAQTDPEGMVMRHHHQRGSAGLGLFE